MIPARALVLLLLLAAAAAAASCRSASPRPAVTAASVAGEHMWLEQFARGYFPGRSGQLFLVPREGEFIVDRNPLYSFMHGSPWPYDTHIPLLLYGPPFVSRGTWDQRVSQQDVVPTLAELIGTAPPGTTTGRALGEALASTGERPRVIALLVLDGARADYLETYKDVLPTLSKLRAGGAWFSDAQVTSVPTLTAVGHANLGTGAEPSIHGLAVNNLFNRVTGKSQEAYDQLDPGEMLALTLADVWNIQTEGQAVIIGQGGAIRATAGLVGHGGCVINGRPVFAASYSARDGGWETNARCYVMPDALRALNARTYWEQAGGAWMGHDIAHPVRFRHSAVFQRFEGDAIIGVLEGAPIGADEITDLVMVNLKGPDYVGHAYGPASAEMREELAELDRQLARALQVLERKAGAGRFVVAVTADHGMPGEPPPGGRHYVDDITKRIDARFSPASGTVVQYFGDPANNEIHLDTAKLRTLNVSLRDVADFLRSEALFAAVYTEDEVRARRNALVHREIRRSGISGLLRGTRPTPMPPTRNSHFHGQIDATCGFRTA